MSQLKNSFDIMGVINITPNSFSDGGQFNSKQSFIEQVKLLQSAEVDIFDIGAESTAPFNSPITGEEELRRFEEVFLPNLKQLPENAIISIDTYRPQVFSRLYKVFKQERADLRLIWNDVSGVMDDQLFKALIEDCPDCDYVYSHTCISEREQTSFHMDYLLACQKGNVEDELRNYFLQAQKVFEQNKISDRVIFDPCFGFSKSMEQNLELIRDVASLVKSFSMNQRWLLGISRKSFLKKSVASELSESERKIQVEQMHAAVLAQWAISMKEHRIAIRLHDPSVADAGIKVAGLFE